MEMKETNLIALYVSKVSLSNQNHLYAKYLEKIIDNEERKMSLVYAEDNGLDVLAITKQVVENIRNIPHEMEHDINLQVKKRGQSTIVQSGRACICCVSSMLLELILIIL